MPTSFRPAGGPYGAPAARSAIGPAGARSWSGGPTRPGNGRRYIIRGDPGRSRPVARLSRRASPEAREADAARVARHAALDADRRPAVGTPQPRDGRGPRASIDGRVMVDSRSAPSPGMVTAAVRGVRTGRRRSPHSRPRAPRCPSPTKPIDITVRVQPAVLLRARLLRARPSSA